MKGAIPRELRTEQVVVHGRGIGEITSKKSAIPIRTPEVCIPRSKSFNFLVFKPPDMNSYKETGKFP